MLSRVKKNKKGVSEVVGYILLISIAVAMSVIVYAWLKSYVPKEPLECPTDTSLMIKEINCSEGILTMALRNNGKFSVYAYTIKYSKDASKSIATDSLAGGFIIKGGYRDGEIIYFKSELTQTGLCENPFEPGAEVEHSFIIDKHVEFIDIVPIRCQQQEGKTKSSQVRCNEARIRQPIICDPEVTGE